MTNPSRQEMSRTEQWLRSHEEWPMPNDDLRAKVIRNASSAQMHAKEKTRSQMILIMCVVFCGAITWIMQDVAGGIQDPQSSALLAVADEGWLRPIDQHVTFLRKSSSRSTYDWALVQAHLTWRRMVYQRLTGLIYQ
jgi:hypothetical protein